ncbi:MAG: hypothetical protein OER77_13845 [Myxococcales bacterium]|nr:hypothetical protein [Myxococcales bacterium]
MRSPHSSLARWLPLLGLWLGCTTVTDDGRTWNPSERLDDEDRVSALFGVALDDGGTALVVWSAKDDVLSRHQPHEGGVGANELIDNGLFAFWPDVAASPNGDAVAVWLQETFFESTDYSIWSNRYTPRVGWETAFRIDSGDTRAVFTPHVAIDPDGNAIAVWRQPDGTRESIWANRSTPDGGWGDAEVIEFDNQGHAADPRVAIDAAGNAIVVWQQSNDVRTSIFSNRYTPGSDWGIPRRISNEDGDARLADVAMGTDGDAIAVWQQTDDGRIDIWANGFTPSAGWGSPERIENNNEGNATEVRVGADADGHAIAVWRQFDGKTAGIWSNRHVPGTGWGSPERIEADGNGDALRPRVAVSAGGPAVAVWVQTDGFSYDAWSNAYTPTPGSGWGIPERIDPSGQGLGQPLRVEVAVDTEGNAVAAWLRRDLGIYFGPPQPSQLWMARFE